MHQRVLMTLAEKDVRQLRQLVSVCIRQKRSISFIIEKVNKAMHGLYSPKGYTELDHDVCSFGLLAGGPRLLHVLHQTSGLPSISRAYRVIDGENTLKYMQLTLTTARKGQGCNQFEKGCRRFKGYY